MAIFYIAEKLIPQLNHRIPLLTKYTLKKKLLIPAQIDVALEFLKNKGESSFTDEEFEKSVGVCNNIN